MIKIIEAKKKDIEPYYKLVFKYMIGDAKGNTEEETTWDANDTIMIERIVRLLNGLIPIKGTWGIILDREILDDFVKEKQITPDDRNFLDAIMYENHYKPIENPIYDDYSGCISDCIKSEIGRTFAVFEGIDLYYYDENGVKHDTEIVVDAR